MVRLEVSDERPMLNMERAGGRIIVTDTRPCAVKGEHILENLDREIYEICDSAKNPEMMVRHLREHFHPKLQWADAAPLVEGLVSRKLLLQSGNRYLSLAVEAPYPKMLTHDDYPGGLVVIPRTQTPAATLPVNS